MRPFLMDRFFSCAISKVMKTYIHAYFLHLNSTK